LKNDFYDIKVIKDYAGLARIVSATFAGWFFGENNAYFGPSFRQQAKWTWF
jgi:hypothetical protein